MKKPLAMIGLAVLALVGSLILFSPTFTVSVPENKVRSEIALRLPVTIEKNGVNVLIRSATVDFLETNRVALQAEADLAGYGLSGAANADVISGLRYENGNFFLSDLSIEDVTFDLDGASQGRLSDVTSIADGIFRAARDRLDAASPGSGSAIDRMRDGALAQVEPALRSAIDDALKTIPVYSLNGRDMKHDLAALALEEVSFSHDAAHATLNPGRALSRVVLGMLLLAFSALGALGMTFTMLGLGRR